MVNVESPQVSVIPDSIQENQGNDSDSDGPILFKDDEEEDEDDEYTSSMCSSLVCGVFRPQPLVSPYFQSIKAFKKLRQINIL